MSEAHTAPPPSLAAVVREWGRIGCIGFGGPPTHIKLLRDLCVERKQWLTSVEFEDAVATCNLLPGPASTQLAIFCAWRVRGRPGALLGGAAFIVPGLILILALAALFLEGAPPRAVLAAGAGAGSAVAAVAVHAAAGLLPASRRRASDSGRAARLRWIAYLVAGLVAAATVGPWLVLVLLACGAFEITNRRQRRDTAGPAAIAPLPLLAIGALSAGTLASLAWVAVKVGALSYGGGFVIIPLMQNDAVNHYHWMTGGQFQRRRAGPNHPRPGRADRRGRGLCRRRATRWCCCGRRRFQPLVHVRATGCSPLRAAARERHRARVSRRRWAGGDRRYPWVGDQPCPSTDPALAIRRPGRRSRGAVGRASRRRADLVRLRSGRRHPRRRWPGSAALMESPRGQQGDRRPGRLNRCDKASRNRPIRATARSVA
jgi:chromate transport protein ChrA